MITLCQQRLVDLNHTSSGKPFQKLLFECFHCEARASVQLYLDGSESGLRLKQPLQADNYLILIDLNENRMRLYPMITQNVDCLRQVNQL